MSRFVGSTSVVLRRIPVLSTVKRSFELLWIYRTLHLRIATPALILLTVGISLGLHKIGSIPPEKLVEALQSLPKSYAILWLGSFSCGLVLLLMFSVSWRRFLLLNVTPGSISFSRPFRRYLILFVAAYFAMIFGATFLADVVLNLMPANMQAPEIMPIVSVLCIFGSLAVMMMLALRYVLLFTAVAVGNSAMKLHEAAAYMKGNVWRFAACWLLIVMAVNFVNNIVGMVLGLAKLDPGGAAGSIIIGSLSAAAMVVTASLTASLAALSYDFLVRGGGPRSGVTT